MKETLHKFQIGKSKFELYWKITRDEYAVIRYNDEDPTEGETIYLNLNDKLVCEFDSEKFYDLEKDYMNDTIPNELIYSYDLKTILKEFRYFLDRWQW